MKKVGELSQGVQLFDTCEYHGRVFKFSSTQGKLVVSELFLGEDVGIREVNTGVDCKCTRECISSCCSLGSKILVMTGEENATDFFCALVTIDPGELTEESIHIEEKRVRGWQNYGSGPYLAQLWDDMVWASVLGSSGIWTSMIMGEELIMIRLRDHLPLEWGSAAFLLPLPDGRFRAVGGALSLVESTLVTPGKQLCLKAVRAMTLCWRDCVSTILIGKRFVVQFGGFREGLRDDMWIFDLGARKASRVTKAGDWHPATCWAFPAIKEGILYILGGVTTKSVHSISLQILSELIQDLDIQEAFQKALGLELRQYPVIARETSELQGMCDLGECLPSYHSYNTVDHQGRVFHFSQCEGKLCVTEIILGPWLKTRTVDTSVTYRTSEDGQISCCSFGDKILVMAEGRRTSKTPFATLFLSIFMLCLVIALPHTPFPNSGMAPIVIDLLLVASCANLVVGLVALMKDKWPLNKIRRTLGKWMGTKQHATDLLCALVSIDPGELTKESIHIGEKKVSGWTKLERIPFLVQLPKDKVWASFLNSNEIWIGEIKGEELVMTRHPGHLPLITGFGALPLRLPDGKLLLAGGWPSWTGIVLISTGKYFFPRKIGDIPGQWKCCVSTVLIGQRFVVGFGGALYRGSLSLAERTSDLWIFDLQTGKTSPVITDGEWHPATYWPFLTVDKGTLYIVGGCGCTSVHSISLQDLSDMIQNVDFYHAFQVSLGLEARRYPPLGQKSTAALRMRKVVGDFPIYRSYNTVDHQGRLLHFSSAQRKLCVTEVFFGPWLKTRTISTGVDCKTDGAVFLSCCPFGDRVLVMAGEKGTADFFCAFVSIDPGELTRESIHIEEKKVTGWKKYEDVPHLAQISENRVWASFHGSNEIWIGEIKGDEMVMTKHQDHLPIDCGFGAPPLSLPDRRLLVAGGGPPLSRAITLITPGEQFFFKKIGDIPGTGRNCVSAILVAGRFVVGFGGWTLLWNLQLKAAAMDDMWIFDLQTCKASPVKKEGEWHPSNSWSILAVRNQDLYVIGGKATPSVHSLSFLALSRLIQHRRVRSAFCLYLGLPLPSNKNLRRRTFGCYIHPRL